MARHQHLTAVCALPRSAPRTDGQKLLWTVTSFLPDREATWTLPFADTEQPGSAGVRAAMASSTEQDKSKDLYEVGAGCVCVCVCALVLFHREASMCRMGRLGLKKICEPLMADGM